MTVQTLSIDGWLPRQVANGSHGHWRTAKAIHDEGVERGFWAAKEAQWRRVHGRARLEVTLVFPDARRRDVDNLYARVKGLLDGLVRAGVLADDDSEHLDLTVRAEVDRRCTCGHERKFHRTTGVLPHRCRVGHVETGPCRCFRFTPTRAARLTLEGEAPAFCDRCGTYPCQCGTGLPTAVRVGRERVAKTDLERALARERLLARPGAPRVEVK